MTKHVWTCLIAVALVGWTSTPAGAWLLLDNFDSYDNSGGTGIGASSGPNLTGNAWLGVFDGTGNAHIVDVGGSNQAAEIWGSSGTGGWRGIEADLNQWGAVLADGATGTYFYRFNPTTSFRADSDGPDWDVMMGLSDNVGTIDNNNSWQDFAVMPFFAGANDGTADFLANGATPNPLISDAARDTWYNVWLVIDNDDNVNDSDGKSYDIYVSTGTDAGTLAGAGANYRNSLGAGALEAISFMSHSDNAMQFDDVYFTVGVDLTNPLAVPEASAFLFGGVACLGVGLGYFRRHRR